MSAGKISTWTLLGSYRINYRLAAMARIFCRIVLNDTHAGPRQNPVALGESSGFLGADIRSRSLSIFLAVTWAPFIACAQPSKVAVVAVAEAVGPLTLWQLIQRLPEGLPFDKDNPTPDIPASWYCIRTPRRRPGRGKRPLQRLADHAMKKFYGRNTPPLLLKLEDIFATYMKGQLIEDFRPFGFSTATVENFQAQGFGRAGEYNDYFLLEKFFRLLGSDLCLNWKFYFKDNSYSSSGFDLFNCPPSRLFGAPSIRHQVKRIFIVYEPDGDYGSLIVNDLLDVRFGRQGRSKKSNHKIVGVSTNRENSIDWPEKSFSTKFAENFKSYISFPTIRSKHKNNQTLQKFIDYFLENFPDACQYGMHEKPLRGSDLER